MPQMKSEDEEISRIILKCERLRAIKISSTWNLRSEQLNKRKRVNRRTQNGVDSRALHIWGPVQRVSMRISIRYNGMHYQHIVIFLPGENTTNVSYYSRDITHGTDWEYSVMPYAFEITWFSPMIYKYITLRLCSVHGLMIDVYM